MTNLWAFLVQTACATVVAALLLVLKTLLNEHLSPRWQYGIWGLLALRLLLPVAMETNILLPIPWWIETLKGWVEGMLHSAYSAQYIPIAVEFPFPVVTGQPRSVTDWLFLIYAVGVAVSLGWYFVSYLRLRLALRRGKPASQAVTDQITNLCARYSLAACPAVRVPGLETAFVCGVFRPVLAVPEDRELDDKVILHELLHLRHFDSGMSIFWCVLRCLHWCNPALQSVFDRIGNDMETLCDQRVLERLEGEERREYGKILLSMANGKYPRTPGTTSVSNGGKNIARRIAAIVRFKKYPRGMGLVSVCIVLVLIQPVIVGSATDYGQTLWNYVDREDMEPAMAMARINRCSTVAGALDCYAQGLLKENGIYVAMASPLDAHPEIAGKMAAANADGWYANRYEAGFGITGGVCSESDYAIYDIRAREDGSYSAYLVFSVYNVHDEAGNFYLLDENGNPTWGCTLIPVRIFWSDGWVVEETGERTIHPIGQSVIELRYGDGVIPLQTAWAEGDYGSVRVDFHTQPMLQERYAGDDIFSGPGYGEHTPDPDAEILSMYTWYNITYTRRGEPEDSVSVHIQILDSGEETPDLPEDAFTHAEGGDSRGSWSIGMRRSWIGWGEILESRDSFKQEEAPASEDLGQFPDIWAQIQFDDAVVDTMQLREVTP